MKTCDDKWNDPLLDLALGVESLEAERHVRDCVSCAAALAFLRADASVLDEALAVLSNPEPSPSFRAQVLADVSEATSRSAWRWVWLGATSAALVGIAFVVVTTTPTRQPESMFDPGLANWHSPTADLLYSASYEQLQQGPHLGGFHFDFSESLFEENNDEEQDES